MANLIDWILIFVSTILFYKSLDRIFQYKSSSVADYIIAVIYIFNCLPILMDNTIGVPKYLSWFYNFELALSNEKVRIIYSLYVLFSITCLFIYLMLQKPKETNIYQHNNSIIFNNKILPAFIILPYIHIIFSGNITKYIFYGTYSARGLPSSFYQINTFFVFVSIFAFCCLFFSKKLNKLNLFTLILYIFSICWIDGKRYIVVTLLITFLFFYLNSVSMKFKRISLKKLFFLTAILLISFNIVYSLKIKPVASNSFDSLYMSYRIDLGRDDVTKFVLYREIILDDPILDYRGQTFISTLFMLVPRDIWSSKPYPHYRYLTAELYGTSSEVNIQSGMTPSLYEMSIANFGVYFGIITTIFLLIFTCWWADNCKSIPRKALYLLLIVGLLTQSMDALLAYVVIVPLSAYISWVKRSIHKKKYFKISNSEGFK